MNIASGAEKHLASHAEEAAAAVCAEVGRFNLIFMEKSIILL
ncbi:MAG TPA: hypothetical protein OIM00_05010 [Oscillospiraceae bacterium]|nr:hypothetical protein [Oscillospiraceae bacterium]